MWNRCRYSQLGIMENCVLQIVDGANVKLNPGQGIVQSHFVVFLGAGVSMDFKVMQQVICWQGRTMEVSILGTFPHIVDCIVLPGSVVNNKSFAWRQL